MYDEFYWITLTILWFLIALNTITLVISFRRLKKARSNLDEAERLLLISKDLERRAREKLIELEENRNDH